MPLCPSVSNRIEAIPTSHEFEPDPYNKYIISKAVEEEFGINVFKIKSCM
jgi:hypothetical protein